MSIKVKKRFKSLSKIVGIGLFMLLMLTNIKLALLDDNELASGDVSLFGIEMQLFDATFAHHEADIDCKSAENYLCSGTTGTQWNERPI